MKILITRYYFQCYNSNYNNSVENHSRIISVSRFNAHPQFLGPTLKLFFKFKFYFGCCLMCVLLSPSGDCFWFEFPCSSTA